MSLALLGSETARSFRPRPRPIVAATVAALGLAALPGVITGAGLLTVVLALAGLPELEVVAVEADTDDIGLARVGPRPSISLLAATGPLSVSLTLSGLLLGLGSPTAASICSDNIITSRGTRWGEIISVSDLELYEI